MRTSLHAFALAIAVAGCCYIHATPACKLDTFTSQYNALVAERQKVPAGAERNAVEAKLADLAAQATAAGKDASSDPPTAVALDRLAVLAAWQGGTAGESRVLPASQQGATACAALPKGDASRPGDCSIIKLAEILAVADSHQRAMRGIQAQLDTLRQANPNAKLPAETRPQLERIFDGFESQFGKATQLRKDLDTLGVNPSLKDTADSDRAVLYCSATTALSRLLDVQAVTPQSIAPMIDRNNAMKAQLEASGHAVDCRTAAATPFVLPDAGPIAAPAR